jgi:hypothetical protein
VKKLIISLTAATALVATAMPAMGQVTAEKRENTTTYATFMVTLNFAQGQAFDERIKLLNEARASAGLEPMVLHHLSGADHDRMVLVPMAEGMASLDWENTPSGAKVDNYLMKKMGEDGYKEWQNGWREVSQRPDVIYSHVHND